MLLVTALAGSVAGQELRSVPVDGFPMRVQVAGLERAGKTPTVVFEAGGGATIEGWGTIPADVAKVAPVVAYDRAGFGGSESDGELPTPHHDAEKLHRLLAQLQLKPPYVLVGHSWGGALIRMFAGLYPSEIAGLVYLDPTDLRTQQQETQFLLDTGFTPEAAAKHLERYWQDWANYLAGLSPRVRSEMRVIEQIERSGAPEFQQLPPVRDVPVSVVLAGKIVPGMWTDRPCQPQACFARWLDYRKQWLRPLTAAARPGRVTVDPESSHDIPRDNPAIVTAEIIRVLDLSRRN
jgi:pimeloyl-ACP methyl ester carboxylesterase